MQTCNHVVTDAKSRGPSKWSFLCFVCLVNILCVLCLVNFACLSFSWPVCVFCVSCRYFVCCLCVLWVICVFCASCRYSVCYEYSVSCIVNWVFVCLVNICVFMHLQQRGTTFGELLFHIFSLGLLVACCFTGDGWRRVRVVNYWPISVSLRYIHDWAISFASQEWSSSSTLCCELQNIYEDLLRYLVAAFLCLVVYTLPLVWFDRIAIDRSLQWPIY